MHRIAARLLVAGIFALVFVSLQPAEADALEVEAGSSPGVPEGAVVDDDLAVMGGTISIDGEVTRDILVLGGTVEINGAVGGSVHVAAGAVEISGEVGDSVRIAGGTVTISGTVGWDVVIAGGTLDIESGSVIENDLIIRGGSVSVEGEVGRDIRGSVGDMALAGNVGRDVRVRLSEELVIRAGVQIGGDLRYNAYSEAEIGDGVSVGGETVFNERSTERAWGSLSKLASWIGSTILRLSWAVVAGTVFVMLLPAQSSGIADHLRMHPFGSLLWGVAAMSVIPVFALFLLLTIIGIPTALFLLGGSIALLYLSQVVVGLALGRALMPGSWRGAPTRGQTWTAMFVGVTIIVIIRMLPIPFGWTFWTSLFTGFLAFGAVWIYLTGLGVTQRGATARQHGMSD